MTGRLRKLFRWTADWRTGAVLVAAVLVALLTIIVIDSIESRRAADDRADRTLAELEITVQELQRRGVRIDALAAQLEEASTSRGKLAEEVRALRELLIDRGVIEPRPQASSSPTPTARRSPRSQPSPSVRPSPKPSSSPKPSPSPTCRVYNPLTGQCAGAGSRDGR